MRSIILIRLLSIAILWLSLSSQASQDTLNHVPSPYHNENNPWFKFGKFKRGFSNDSLKLTLDSLELKKRKNWSRRDSLVFASTSLKTGNIALSDYYFDHLNVNINSEEDFWYDHLMIYLLNGEYTKGLKLIKSSVPGIYQYSKIDFFRKVFIAKSKQAEDSKWYKSNKVLNWEVDSSMAELDREGEIYQERIIRPLNNLNEVLVILIHYIHEEDPILAKMCYEMGMILEYHVSLTQAYIAYSLGRHYNKWDKDILNRMKGVKAKMMERKLKIPIFRRYFPRIEYWRFDYDVLKEKVISERNDTLDKIKPDIIQPKHDDEPLVSFPLQIVTIGGLLVMFLMLLFFLKTRRK